MSYKEKLEGFNSTDKYTTESMFSKSLFNTDMDNVLDYGCGTGYLVNNFNNDFNNTNFYGYDVNLHNKDFGYSELLGKYDLVYFMHSIAHIKDVGKVLRRLRTEEIIVITPNKKWLDLQNNKNYKPDTTVVGHFTHSSLLALFNNNGYEVIISGQFGSVTDEVNERLFLKARKND